MFLPLRTLAIAAVCCGSTLAVIPTAQAAEVANFAAKKKTWGGWAAGKTFTFTITEKVSAATVGTKVKKNVPVPKGIPDFKVGKKVKFTIGKKGELTGSGFSIPFKADGITANAYATLPTASNPNPNIGQVFKTTSHTPVGGALTFYKTSVKVSGTSVNVTTNMVNYLFE